MNQLQTALHTAVAAEDYVLAARVRDVLSRALGQGAPGALDWRQLGLPEWLAERAEDLGFRLPTGEDTRGGEVQSELPTHYSSCVHALSTSPPG